MHIMFITFGLDITHHFQANFAILTFLQYNLKGVENIHILTDQPNYYQHIEDRINIIPIDQSLLEQWKGPHQYVFRAKIKAIEHLIYTYGDSPILYLDADTFLNVPSNSIQKFLESGKAIMHENEGKLMDLKGETTLKMWEQVKGKTFGEITVTPDHFMWNAGVIGIPAHQNKESIRRVLTICDEMYDAGVTPYFIEQFSFSIVLSKHYELKEANKWIGHYWRNKMEWNEMISSFFLKSQLKELSYDSLLEKMKGVNFHSIPTRKPLQETQAPLIKITD